MSIAGFDTLHPVHEAPKQANENVASLAIQANSPESLKLLMDANVKMLNTAEAHLPVGFSIEEHTTANGWDVKTLTGKDGKVLATDSIDQDGHEVTHANLYDRETGKKIAEQDKDDMGTMSRHFDPKTGELKDSVHNNYDGTVDARIYSNNGDLVSEINKDKNDIETVYHHDPLTGRITREVGDLKALPGERNFFSNQSFGEKPQHSHHALSDDTGSNNSFGLDKANDTQTPVGKSFKDMELSGLDQIKQGFKTVAADVSSSFRELLGRVEGKTEGPNDKIALNTDINSNDSDDSTFLFTAQSQQDLYAV